MSVAITTNAGKLVYLHRPDAQHVGRVIDQLRAGTYPPAEPPPAGAAVWSLDNAYWILGAWLPGRYRRMIDRYDIRAGRWIEEDVGPGRDVLTDLSSRNLPALRVMVEAYLAHVVMPDGRIVSYEVACCDGSSHVPDIMRPCGRHVKDPASMAHDYIYDLNHSGSPVDAFSVRWNKATADDAYCDILRAADMPFAAARREIGLMLFSAGYWTAGTSRTGLAA